MVHAFTVAYKSLRQTFSLHVYASLLHMFDMSIVPVRERVELRGTGVDYQNRQVSLRGRKAFVCREHYCCSLKRLRAL
jgi:hypothetical protein